MNRSHAPILARDFQLRGHLPGSGIQSHSAGGLFPYILYAQQYGEQVLHGYQAPGQDGILVGTYDDAAAAALQAKTYQESVSRKQAQLDRYQASRNLVDRSAS
jgi:hypothetical protein